MVGLIQEMTPRVFVHVLGPVSQTWSKATDPDVFQVILIFLLFTLLLVHNLNTC